MFRIYCENIRTAIPDRIRLVRPVKSFSRIQAQRVQDRHFYSVETPSPPSQLNPGAIGCRPIFSLSHLNVDNDATPNAHSAPPRNICENPCGASSANRHPRKYRNKCVHKSLPGVTALPGWKDCTNSINVGPIWVDK